MTPSEAYEAGVRDGLAERERCPLDERTARSIARRLRPAAREAVLVSVTGTPDADLRDKALTAAARVAAEAGHARELRAIAAEVEQEKRGEGTSAA